MSLKKILIIYLLLLIIPFKVNAEECSKEFKQNISKLASNIDITYQYIENDQFNFIIYNLPKNIVLEENVNYSQISNMNGETSVRSNTFIGGANVTFSMYYKGGECNTYLINMKTVKLPYYNEYWDKEICQNAKEYIYCQKFIPSKMSYESLEKNVKRYIEKNSQVVIEEEIEDKNIFSTEVILIISGISLLLIIILISIILKRKKRRRKL